MRIKCAEKTSVGMWGQSRDPRELPGVAGAGPGVAGVLQLVTNLCQEYPTFFTQA